MRRDAVYSLLCALSVQAGLAPLAWQTMAAVEWRDVVRRRSAQ